MKRSNQQPYRLIYRRRGRGAYYCVDTRTGKRESLGKVSRLEAEKIVAAKIEAQRQPALNIQMAKAYLSASDPALQQRTWKQALDVLTQTKHGANKDRWQRAAKDRALAPLLPRVIVEADAAALLAVLRNGTVSTNVFLRRLYNFCVDMNWLPWPLLPKRQWPRAKYKEKRAITWEEHCRILEREQNPERKAYYQLAWHLGASQSDLARLRAEDVDWTNKTISFIRRKTEQPALIRFGNEVEAILVSLPKLGPIFPYLATVRCSDRATEFRQRCAGLGISGVTLHSYRYAWAERAQSAGYPERFAQLALGHGSKAVHRAYARHARVTLPPLEDYEKKLIPFIPPGTREENPAA